MRRRLVAAVLVLVAVSVAAPGAFGAASAGRPERPTPRFAHLDPGGQPDLDERVPVNVVLVGYDRDEVDLRVLRRSLPRAYEPIVRSRLWYGRVEPLGIDYRYDYRIAVASRRYEDRLFRHLSSIATDKPLTAYQEAYNQQAGTLDVTDNAWIDAPSAERWLAYHAPRGVDTRENTVYLINWFGRPDFRFHVYTKTDEPEPDTGYNFGVERDNRKLSAWGGTTARDEETGLGSTRRVWFHDLSAGPEGFAGGYDVTDADLDGDDVADYRIPPAWEYADGGYRSPDALTGDLARVVRNVALDLLMTTSPIYPVELPTREPPTSVDLDSNTYEGWAGVDASGTLIKPGLLTSELAELLRFKRLSYDNQDLPFTGRAAECYADQFVNGVSCDPASGLPVFANLFLQNLEDLARTKDDGDTVDYELPLFNYAVDSVDPGLLGYADDNWSDGTASFVFRFVDPTAFDGGYGLTTTLIHEVGHHVGLSHPHDGYDAETGVDYGPTGDYYFAWLGTSVNSMMSYIDLNWDFSQFDQDNMARFQAAAYVEAANRPAAEALAATRPARALDELRRADGLIGRAERAFAGHRYQDAWSLAGRAYALAADGAEDAGVDVEQSVQAALREARGSPRVPQGPDGAAIDTLEPGDPRSRP